MNDNRIAGYIETPLRLSPGEFIVTGNWVSTKLNKNTEYIVKHYRNEMPVGVWKIISVVNFSTKTGPKIGFKVSSDNKFAYFQVGDIIADNKFDVEFYNVELENHSVNEGVIVGNVADNEFVKTVIYPGLSGETMGLMSLKSVFLTDSVQVKTVKGTIIAKILGKKGLIDQEHPLEVRIDSKPKILLTELINTMNPLRSFIIDVTKEYTMNNNDNKKKVLSSIYEPAVEVKSGSIRMLLAPNGEGQLSIDDPPSGLAYELLYKILADANNEKLESVIQIMSANFVNARKHMNNLLNIIRPFYKKGLIEISLPGYEKIRIKSTAYKTIKKALDSISSREIKIIGQVYAIDTIRKWFRVIDLETGVDWKIVYTQKDSSKFDLTVLTEKKIQVFASTFASAEARRGIAEYKRHEFTLQ